MMQFLVEANEDGTLDEFLRTGFQQVVSTAHMEWDLGTVDTDAMVERIVSVALDTFAAEGGTITK